MITWSNGQIVFGLVGSEKFKVQLNRFNKKTKQLEFIDKNGKTFYYCRRHQVEFVLPDYWVPTYRISDLMIMGKDDYYE